MDIFILNKENEIKKSGIKSQNIEDRLDDLVREISTAKLVVDENKPFPERTEEIQFDDNEVVSETLAKIYFSQGNINEALNVYEKLKIKFPEKILDFQKKIDNIKNQ